MTEAAEPTERTIVTNRRARHDYHIEDVIETGLVLTGTEVKSIRARGVSLSDAFARVQNGEVWLYNLHVNPYEQGNIFNHDPLRPRKLLLRRGEIAALAAKAAQKGYTLVPLRLYFRRGLVKAEIGVARGKKLYDKRESVAAREARREMDRAGSVRAVSDGARRR
ncbi:MAG: SsrA-binding protein SmpB [Armatimonadetes bacterium]|nr:SsrA-binding protein SmpB [Armatimonadota bacterium]